jgi:hypothetical protein
MAGQAVAVGMLVVAQWLEEAGRLRRDGKAGPSARGHLMAIDIVMAVVAAAQAGPASKARMVQAESYKLIHGGLVEPA